MWKVVETTGAPASCHMLQTENPRTGETGGPHSGHGGPGCAPSNLRQISQQKMRNHVDTCQHRRKRENMLQTFQHT